jgi:hypothetical protein
MGKTPNGDAAGASGDQLATVEGEALAHNATQGSAGSRR